MATLLVRSAPGVCSISLRVTMADGVMDSGSIPEATSDTSTDWRRDSIDNCKCSNGALPETTVMGPASVAKPSLAIVTSYWPAGTAENTKPPSSSVSESWVHAGDQERSVAVADGTGR